MHDQLKGFPSLSGGISIETYDLRSVTTLVMRGAKIKYLLLTYFNNILHFINPI